MSVRHTTVWCQKWDLVADFSLEEPFSVVSITPVSDARNVVNAVDIVLVSKNVERAALRLLEEIAEEVNESDIEAKPHSPSPPSNRTNEPEGRAGSISSPPPP